MTEKSVCERERDIIGDRLQYELFFLVKRLDINYSMNFIVLFLFTKIK